MDPTNKTPADKTPGDRGEEREAPHRPIDEGTSYGDVVTPGVDRHPRHLRLVKPVRERPESEPGDDPRPIP